MASIVERRGDSEHRARREECREGGESVGGGGGGEQEGERELCGSWSRPRWRSVGGPVLGCVKRLQRLEWGWSACDHRV